ncbi:uncharacterized protein LACBIDRAFT_318102 [Laccaria bicolor S238N-H82]|uniref:Predicted protein n=1 Tax=Laccaria bicolor (strain S238N-H82 / ATCC MYA-4686) TaxID=486041 RepID=B0D5Z9_LACBS|nr:uncharacterized protein LACBIDRAFT_318102 [Laccaria bicolor S238N-H82]EDR09856.1 predicted protein [Laccaria bicolor S238N-H82]|eukprot:XP_001879241.1 predicted protein [Laccaria bicolor S238N-H82]
MATEVRLGFPWTSFRASPSKHHYLVAVHPTGMQIAVWFAIFGFGLHHNKE